MNAAIEFNSSGETWQRTMELRQVVAQPQGLIGIQQKWVSPTGKIQWRWINTVSMQRAETDK